MKNYWIDFSSSMFITANNKEDAEKIFWAWETRHRELDFSRVDCVEEDLGR